MTPLTTRVGRAEWGDNLFCGYRVLAQLLGRESLWSMLSLAIGGPRLGKPEERLLDDASTAAFAGDPRIWPLKLTRLAASYGRVYPALCAGLVPMEGALVGPAAGGPAARQLVDIQRALGDRIADPGALERHVAGLLDRGIRIPGFGVPYRQRDERFDALAHRVEAHGRHQLPYWKLVRKLDEILGRRKRLPPNIAAGTAALLLDLGYTPSQIDVFPMLFLLSAFLANAVEGARQAPAVLRELPAERVEYVGPPPRRSPRAEASSAGEAGGASGRVDEAYAEGGQKRCAGADDEGGQKRWVGTDAEGGQMRWAGADDAGGQKR
jgi:hypothetical protein